MKGRGHGAGHWLPVPFLCRQLSLQLYRGYQWRGSVIREQQQEMLAESGRLAVGSNRGDQRLECVCRLENNCKSLLKCGLAVQPGHQLCLAVYSHGRGEYVVQGGTSAMLHSVLISHDPAPIQFALGDSEKFLERKWLVLSKKTETGLCCSLQYPKISWLILLPSTGW